MDAGTEVHAWVVVRPDDTGVIRIARSEMGQGTLTGLAQLVAEELECDWKNVATESITPGQNLARKRIWGEMGTGGSRGIRTSHDYARRGGAAARMMLLQAAADEWKVPVGEVSVANGVITHAASGRKTTYGKVAAAAAKLTPPDPRSITLKDPKDWKIAGKPMKRLDTADKLNGSKVYAIDLKRPGMVHAAIKACPVFGGKLVSYDEAKISGRPGVRGVVMEEVARAAGADSLEFRRALMSRHPKHLAVLNAAADKGNWGKPLPAGVHRGIAQFMGYGSYSAAVAEVSVNGEGTVKVHRMVLALDCGHAVNPDQIAAQVEGSVAYGLTAAFYGECTVQDGGGVGEPTISVVTPAVLNAVFAATGKPVRSLPLKNVKLV